MDFEFFVRIPPKKMNLLSTLDLAGNFSHKLKSLGVRTRDVES